MFATSLVLSRPKLDMAESHRLVIPKVIRPETISKSHTNHLGIDAFLTKSRNAVFWLGVNSETKGAVSKCSMCEDVQAKNSKQPMQRSKLPRV